MQDGSGTLSLAVNGPGLTLYGSSTHSGGTTISAGTLQLGNGTSNGVLVGNISNSGVLAFNNAAAQTYGGVISGNGTLNLLGPGLLVLTNTNTLSGPTTISAGTLQIGNGTTSGSLVATGSISNNATLAFNNVGTLTQGANFSGSPISGSGALVVLGPGAECSTPPTATAAARSSTAAPCS